MKNRRTVNCDELHTLPGGNEDNYLWAYSVEDEKGMNVIASVWEPTDEERARIAKGENIRLCVWGTKTPPVAIDLTDEAIGKKMQEANDSSPDMEDNST